jgi:hypothetical protein
VINFKSKLPYIIGVVGHRNIVEESKQDARNHFEKIVKSYKAKYPNTPILVVTSLAEGADQLIADVAINVEGVFLGVLIPMEIDKYLETFSNDSAREEFNRFCSKAIFVRDTSTDIVFENDFDAYRNNTRELSNNADLLIALWDGIASNQVGGTSDTLYYKLKKIHRPKNLTDVALNQKEFGSAIVIPVSRIGNQSPLVKKNPYSLKPVSLEETSIDEESDFIAVSKHNWNKLKFESQAPSLTYSEILTKNALNLAVKMRKKFIIALLIILSSSFLTIVAIEIQSRSTSKTISVATIFVALSAFIIYQIVTKLEIKDKYHQFQAVSEAGEIQQLWSRLGMSQDVSDYFLTGINSSFDWMRSLVRTISFLDRAQTTMKIEADTKEFMKIWISRQILLRKGDSKIVGSIKKNNRLASFIRIITIVLIIFSLFIWGYFSISLIFGIDSAISTRGLLQSLFVLALAAAATFSSYSYLLALREMVIREEKALYALDNAMESLSMDLIELPPLVHGREVAKSLGIFFLNETSEWYVRNYDRKVKGLLQ